MPKTSHPLGIKIYGIDGQLLEGATVVLTLNSETTSETSNAKGEAILNTSKLTSGWSVGDEVSITASKTGSGTKTETLVLDSSGGQQLSITLEETSDLFYHKNEDDEYVLNFSLLTTYDGEKVTTSNPLPVSNQNPISGYHWSDIERGDPEYIGYLDKDGKWYIVKNSRTSGERRYVSGQSDYPTNWTNKESLVYEYFNQVF